MKKLIEMISKLKYADYLLILYILLNLNFIMDIINVGSVNINSTYIILPLFLMLSSALAIVFPIPVIKFLILTEFVKKHKIINFILNIIITVIFIFLYLVCSLICMIIKDNISRHEYVPYSEKVAIYEKALINFDEKEALKYFPKKISQNVNKFFFEITDKKSFNYLELYTNKEYIDKVIQENNKYIFWNENADVICNNFKICSSADIPSSDNMYILKGNEEYPKYLSGFSVSQKQDRITFFSSKYLYLNQDANTDEFFLSQNDYQYVIPFLFYEDRSYYYQLMPKSIPQNAQNYSFNYDNGIDSLTIVVGFNIDEKYINNIIKKNQILLLPKEELSKQYYKQYLLINSENYDDYFVYYLKKYNENLKPTAGIVVSKKKDEIIFFMTTDNLM